MALNEKREPNDPTYFCKTKNKAITIQPEARQIIKVRFFYKN